MKIIEKNIVNSFQYAKRDIVSLQQQISQLRSTQEHLLKIIQKKGYDEFEKQRKLAKSSTRFVASKSAKKFHAENCPFAKNIKPQSKVFFTSKDIALNNGFKPCECIKAF